MIPAIFNDFVYIFVPVFLFIRIIWLFTEILNYNDYSNFTGKNAMLDPYKRTITEHCIWWGTFILMFIDSRFRLLSYHNYDSMFLYVFNIITYYISRIYFYACPVAILFIERIAKETLKENK